MKIEYECENGNFVGICGRGRGKGGKLVIVEMKLIMKMFSYIRSKKIHFQSNLNPFSPSQKKTKKSYPALRQTLSNTPLKSGISATAVSPHAPAAAAEPATPTPVAPAAIIPLTAAPPIAALWHHANKLPASTAPMDACHAAAEEPATGPRALKPIAPKMRGAARDVAVMKRPVIFRVVKMWGCDWMKLVVLWSALRSLLGVVFSAFGGG